MITFRLNRLFFAISMCVSLPALSDDALPEVSMPTPQAMAATPTINKPMSIPSAPNVAGKAYILIDVDSGKIIAENNSETKLPPASLTKLMTLFVASNALKNNQIKLTDQVRVSKEAWQTGGSRMFIKEGDEVSVENLLKGIIVDSGNDACVALAEHLGGSEQGFSDIMNQQAKLLGMNNSHFTDSTGLPNPDHYTTAKDLAILGRALVSQFPEYHDWYKLKWFEYNGIKQPNRNRLLWRDEKFDGLKTGHTDEAGFCLVSSAKENDMRLLAVVLGEPSDSIRADDSQRLLNFGFRFYETKQLYQPNHTVTNVSVYKGDKYELPIGTLKAQYVTIPKGQYDKLTISTQIPSTLIAPIQKGAKIATLSLTLDDKVIATQNLYALDSVNQGGLYTRAKDSIKLAFHRWFSAKSEA